MKAPARKPIRDAVREASIFRARAGVGFVLICLGFAVLLGRYFYLQVVQHDTFITRAESNRVKYRALAPNRGLIVDRNGVILADNQPAYRLELIPEQVSDMPGILQRLSTVVELSEDELTRFEKLRRARRSFQTVPLKLRLDESEVARFAVERHHFPGVDIVPYQTRVYPLGKSFAHVLGYVGQLDADDLQQLDASRYAATAHIGKSGVERFYEDLLHGQVGREKVETNAQGRILRSLEKSPPRSGSTLHLTIDAGLQQAAVAAMAGHTGAVVAVAPATGEVLALASLPSFDPNLFVSGISVADYRRLVNSPQRPLFNRAVQGGYEPGSTLKPYIALAGLESGIIDLDHTVFSGGSFQLPGQARRYRDWKRGGHGQVDVVGALEQSVNVFFYDLANNLGIDRIHEYLSQFGFGRPTGIDLNGESPGILPSRAWKRAHYNLPWYPGETVITGIGQGFTVTTPLQLSQAAAILAARGQAAQLHLVSGVSHESIDDTVAARPAMASVAVNDLANWEAVIEGMSRVVHGAKGTARALSADDPPYRMAGKTGTAQVYGLEADEEYVEEDVASHLRHHALFVAFAPIHRPTIAVAVVVEHGGGGSRVAAPIARQLIDYHMALTGQHEVAEDHAQ